MLRALFLFRPIVIILIKFYHKTNKVPATLDPEPEVLLDILRDLLLYRAVYPHCAPSPTRLWSGWPAACWSSAPVYASPCLLVNLGAEHPVAVLTGNVARASDQPPAVTDIPDLTASD